MSIKVIHQHKIPKSATVALYAIAIALTLNLAKPFLDVGHAQAEGFGVVQNFTLERIRDSTQTMQLDISTLTSMVETNGIKLDSIKSTLVALDQNN